MSFELGPNRLQVAFDITTGELIDDKPDDARCKLDIHSNISMDMGGMQFADDTSEGNFSRWVELQAGEGVAVTGLTSCGAVFLANSDFSRVAAGHMSGDARLAKAWCSYIHKSGTQPAFLLWGTGAIGARGWGGRVLMSYMKEFRLAPSRAPAVAGCGAVFLVRSNRGCAFAWSAVQMPFQTVGQAVRRLSSSSLELAAKLTQYASLRVADEAGTIEQSYMLLYELSDRSLPIVFEDEARLKSILENGPGLMRAYAKVVATFLPSYIQDFQQWKLFRTYPKLKPAL